MTSKRGTLGGDRRACDERPVGAVYCPFLFCASLVLQRITQKSRELTPKCGGIQCSYPDIRCQKANPIFRPHWRIRAIAFRPPRFTKYRLSQDSLAIRNTFSRQIRDLNLRGLDKGDCPMADRADKPHRRRTGGSRHCEAPKPRAECGGRRSNPRRTYRVARLCGEKMSSIHLAQQQNGGRPTTNRAPSTGRGAGI